jgi:hypothetical protein
MPHIELCEEKTKLFVEYQQAERVYSLMTRELAEAAGVVASVEIDLLKRRLDIAKRIFQNAKEKFEQHAAHDHHC